MKTTSMLRAGVAPAALGLALVATPAFAQAQTAADEGDSGGAPIIVTGSRIARPNLEANSPIAVVTGDQTTEHGDVTLDTFLNTLPQVNPAGTTTSNNPGNNGQANINLRGLGANRNLVLINGRRAMVSSSDQTVDLNTIPQSLIERIDVMTGGAGAAYGADAIAGVVNMVLKRDFHGIDARATYSNSVPYLDSRELQLSGTFGLNFGDGRGNIAVAVEYAEREQLVKSQRGFASQATSTTNTPPMGRYISSGSNLPDQNVINSVFAKYGVSAAQAPTASNIMFNNDGTLIGRGIFNSPVDVANYRFAANGSDKAAANQLFYPDFYSYNFDYVNLLVLPLNRKSAFVTSHYEFSPAIDVFVQGNYTKYDASTALAPTPVGTTIENPCGTGATRAKSNLVTCGKTITGLIAPITNPFIPADLATILASRSMDDPALTGSGATEGVRISKRFLDTGLRQQDFTNEVYQILGGLRGEFAPGWRYEAYFSYGHTKINQTARGNIDVQKVQNLLEAADGGKSICAGGFDPFGIKPLSQACTDYVSATGRTQTDFTQKVYQGYVTGNVLKLPAGDLAVNAGVERREFSYKFDPGALFGPIAGFNTATPDHGTNSFTDFFGEVLVPLVADAAWAKRLELSLGYRHSRSAFNDIQNGVTGKPQNSSAYKAELTWQPIDEVRLRGSYQRSVRAPNFGELFSGGGSFPQYFDPCSATTAFRKNGGAAALALCQATGVSTPSYVQTPGSQAYLGISGNTGLKPEKADTWTAGVVFNSGRFVASLDYYNIRLKDTIFTPDPNIIIGACYNYFGKNPTLSASSPYCEGIKPGRTPDISFISVPASLGGDSSGYFQAINQGQIKTSGLDFQAAYRLPTDFAKPGSQLNVGFTANYLFDYKVEELPGVTINYAGTASYFGAGLGTSFPKFRGNLNLDWVLKPVTLSTRIRYIDSMKNRAAVQFAGESFTGPGAVAYVDIAAQVEINQLTLRIGANNLFNRKPPTYSPNVQSGTDPSLYDVVGRRLFVSARIRY